MDVLDRADLPFPHSLPEFQRLFPDDAPLLQPMPSFTRERGGTLHVAVMGVNRIGKIKGTQYLSPHYN